MSEARTLIAKRKGEEFEVLVDAADYDRVVAAGPWYVDPAGYAINGGGVRVHRLVLECTKGDGLVIDHLNRNRRDNRRSNLSPGTQAENAQNVGSHVDARSPHRGVFPFRGRWQAQFMRNGERYHVGTFATEAEAARALEEARDGE